jgi:hypothetical protein
MSLTVNCCEGMSISKLFCNWCLSNKNKEDASQVLYTDSIKQIVILSTPKIDFPEILLFEDLQETDIIIFSLDQENQIRFISVQGSHLLKALTATPSDNTSSSPKLPKITNNKDLVGKTLQETLPDYIIRFLEPIYQQTLQGAYLQLTTMWMRTTQLVRTFPVFNHKKDIIAGIAITSPFNPDFNGEINKFSLNPPKRTKTHRTEGILSEGPRPQQMNHNETKTVTNHHHPPTPSSWRQPPLTPKRKTPISNSTGVTQTTTTTTLTTIPTNRPRAITIDNGVPLFHSNDNDTDTDNNDGDNHNNNNQPTESTDTEQSINQYVGNDEKDPNDQ